jgi:DNA repair exonuclease SbcCD ATPase subunit
VSSLYSLSKDNEELRAYIEILKSALDNKALQVGLGNQKGFVLRELETLKQRLAQTQRQLNDVEQSYSTSAKNLEQATNDLDTLRLQLEHSTTEEKKLRRLASDLQYLFAILCIMMFFFFFLGSQISLWKIEPRKQRQIWAF